MSAEQATGDGGDLGGAMRLVILDLASASGLRTGKRRVSSATGAGGRDCEVACVVLCTTSVLQLLFSPSTTRICAVLWCRHSGGAKVVYMCLLMAPRWCCGPTGNTPGESLLPALLQVAMAAAPSSVVYPCWGRHCRASMPNARGVFG